MAKLIEMGSAPPDHPIYREGPIFHNPGPRRRRQPLSREEWQRQADATTLRWQPTLPCEEPGAPEPDGTQVPITHTLWFSARRRRERAAWLNMVGRAP
jgi:hypothetical protein